MHEVIKNNLEANRSRLIKARAFFDAGEYINLMKKVSPESLEPSPSGEITINTIDSERLLEEARGGMNLTPNEMVEYLVYLSDRVKKIMSVQLESKVD